MIAPLIWHGQRGNSGPFCIALWNFVMPLNSAINGIIWRNDAINRVPVWCDISGKIQLGGYIGSIVAPFCVARYLAFVLRPNATPITTHQRRNRAIFDIGLSIGGPLLAMAFHPLWQQARFGIFRTTGCGYTGTLAWPIYPLFLIWPPVFASLGTLYACYIVYRLWSFRRNFDKIVTDSRSALTVPRLLRLSILCVLYLIVELPISIVGFISTEAAFGPMQPYSLKAIRSSPDLVYQYPLVDKATFPFWTPCIGALVVAVFLGLGSESGEVYSGIGRQVWRIVGRDLDRSRRGPPAEPYAPDMKSMEEGTGVADCPRRRIEIVDVDIQRILNSKGFALESDSKIQDFS